MTGIAEKPGFMKVPSLKVRTKTEIGDKAETQKNISLQIFNKPASKEKFLDK
jgi:hypothetical protein